MPEDLRVRRSLSGRALSVITVCSLAEEPRMVRGVMPTLLLSACLAACDTEGSSSDAGRDGKVIANGSYEF